MTDKLKSPNLNKNLVTDIEEPKIKEEKKVIELDENVKIMQEVLAEYNGVESDIPINHPKYWTAKRRL